MNRILIALICTLGLAQAPTAWCEDLVTIALEDRLMFSTPNGDVVNVAAGRYRLALAEAGALSLMPPEGESIIVSATHGTHEIDLAEPVARVIAGEDEATYYLTLILPDGKFAESVGSRGAIVSRGINPRLRRRQRLIAMGLIPARPISPKIPNVALKKKARQSSRFQRSFARLAVDGDTNSNWRRGSSVTHTRKQQNPWWEVDLGKPYDIQKIEIWNRTDCCAERLDRLSISIAKKSGGAGQGFFSGSRRYNSRAKNPLTFYGNKTGRFVRVKLQGKNYLSLAEVKVYGLPAAPPVKPPDLPDLAVTELTVRVTNPGAAPQTGVPIYTHSHVHVTAKVRNLGTQSVLLNNMEPSHYKMQILGHNRWTSGSLSPEGLAPDEEANAYGHLARPREFPPGNYEIVVTVDPDDDILEISEENNVFSKAITILPSPMGDGPSDLEITAIRSLPRNPPPPNLISFLVEVDITNHGPGWVALSGGQGIKLRDLLEIGPPPGLNYDTNGPDNYTSFIHAGETKTLHFIAGFHCPLATSVGFRFTLDPYNVHDETNEDNNTIDHSWTNCPY